jgi:hypothetical protein
MKPPADFPAVQETEIFRETEQSRHLLFKSGISVKEGLYHPIKGRVTTPKILKLLANYGTAHRTDSQHTLCGGKKLYNVKTITSEQS